MTIRLHPATQHGDRLHRLARTLVWEPRVALTRCHVPFVWGTWKDRSHAPLPRCAECWA